MHLPFKQGIVQAQPSFLSWNDSSIAVTSVNKPTVVTVSHGVVNYIHVEPKTQGPITKWVNLPTQPSTDFWLYWDIDLVNAQITYGHTVHQPIILLTDPSTSAIMPIDQHWYDLSQQIMKVWTGTSWAPRLRVFAARVFGGSNISPYPTGTQVGLNIPIVAGKILRDSTGRPIKKSDRTFITSEDKFFIDNSDVRISNLEHDVITGRALENIPGYSVVKMTKFDEFNLADYEDTSSAFLGMVLDDTAYGDSLFVIAQGVITNNNWSWTIPNQKLWIDQHGQLSQVDPGDVDLTRGSQEAIARVMSPNSILFGQGLFNEAGTEATSSGTGDHDHTEYAPIIHGHTEYAPIIHGHTEYAPIIHGHTEYAPTSHTHAEFETIGDPFSVDENHTWTKAQRGAFVPLSIGEGNLIIINLNASNNFYYLVNGDFTLVAPENAVAGQSGIIEFVQGETPYSIVIEGFWKFPGGVIPDLTQEADAKDTLSYTISYDGTYATCVMLPNISNSGADPYGG